MTNPTPTPDMSAPPVDLAEIERLVEAYGDAVEQLGRDMEREGARWTDTRPTDATHEALLTAIRQLAARQIAADIQALFDIEDARQLASAPVAVPAGLRVLSEKATREDVWKLGWQNAIGNAAFSFTQSYQDVGPDALICLDDVIERLQRLNTPSNFDDMAIRALISAEDARQLADRTALASDPGSDEGRVKGYSHSEAVRLGYLCDDCPPPGYPTDKTRCTPCPARAAPHPPVGEKAAADATTMGER